MYGMFIVEWLAVKIIGGENGGCTSMWAAHVVTR